MPGWARPMTGPKLVGLAIGLVGLLMLTGGCATMQAYREESARWQALADQATGALGAGSVTVHVQAGQRGVYHCQARQIDLGTDMPEPNVRLLLSHELAHQVNGDCLEGNAQVEQAAN